MFILICNSFNNVIILELQLCIKIFITICSVSKLITFVIKLHIDIALSYIYIVLNYMRIQAPYALTGFHHIYILLTR